MADRLELARNAYVAYETGNRALIDGLLGDDFIFFSPSDVGIDRATYFERCWPNSELIASYEFERLEAIGEDAVLVTYEARKHDGKRFRNTEVLTFDGDRISRAEV